DNYLVNYPENRLPLKPTGERMTKVEARQRMKAGGCYDSSIVTVADAALANRAPKLSSLRNRSARFFDLPEVTGKNGKPIPREVHQVAWQYYQALQGQNKVAANGKVVQPLYFHEIVADIGGGKIREACDPYTYGKCRTATAANRLASA